METIEIVVMDYYNHPGYYHFMPDNIFEILENAFLFDEETAIVPANDFNKMIEAYNECVAESKETGSSYWHILKSYHSSKN